MLQQEIFVNNARFVTLTTHDILKWIKDFLKNGKRQCAMIFGKICYD
jgi:hypothetical protein